jgi:hypothetical protein
LPSYLPTIGKAEKEQAPGQRNSDDTRRIDRGRDRDRELISRQLSINLNFKSPTLVAKGAHSFACIIDGLNPMLRSWFYSR